MPTVYVLQEAPGRNLTPAIRFGELKILMPPGDISLMSEVTYSFLFKALKDFTKDDYIILMGAPRAIAAVGFVLPMIVGGPYKVLNWDRQCGEYVPSSMNPPMAHKGEAHESDRHVPRPAEKQPSGQVGQAPTRVDS